MKIKWKPPVSPLGLLQEKYWPDEWRILVCCLLLNQTTRRQVDKIIDEFFLKYPGPVSMCMASGEELHALIQPLGLANKRVKTLKRFSHEYLTKTWQEAKDLYGCGKYANDTWRIFCRGDWEDVSPQDHALNNYHGWLRGYYESRQTA